MVGDAGVSVLIQVLCFRGPAETACEFAGTSLVSSVSGLH